MQETKIDVAQESFEDALEMPTPEQMEMWNKLLRTASRDYVKNMIRSVEHKKIKTQRRKKAKMQKASRRQNRK